MNIRELKNDEDIRRAFPVVNELRTDLRESDYMAYVGSMRREGYRLFGLFKDAGIVAVAGLAILTNFYYKRHVWIYDLVTTEKERSKGYGFLLMKFIEDLALKEKCQTIALSSGLERSDTHRFYLEKMGYTKPSFVFKKCL